MTKPVLPGLTKAQSEQVHKEKLRIGVKDEYRTVQDKIKATVQDKIKASLPTVSETEDAKFYNTAIATYASFCLANNMVNPSNINSEKFQAQVNGFVDRLQASVKDGKFGTPPKFSDEGFSMFSTMRKTLKQKPKADTEEEKHTRALMDAFAPSVDKQKMSESLRLAQLYEIEVGLVKEHSIYDNEEINRAVMLLEDIRNLDPTVKSDVLNSKSPFSDKTRIEKFMNVISDLETNISSMEPLAKIEKDKIEKRANEKCEHLNEIVTKAKDKATRQAVEKIVKKEVKGTQVETTSEFLAPPSTPRGLQDGQMRKRVNGRG